MIKENYKVVVASNRPKHLEEFKSRWVWEDKLISVLDEPSYHQLIDKDLGKDSWIIPRFTGAIRSYGILKAIQDGADWIIILDDDCYPIDKEQFVNIHYNYLTSESVIKWSWTGEPRTRGIPYELDSERVVLNHGLWEGIPDYDAINSFEIKPFKPLDKIIPIGYYFPMCGMNLAFRREIAPLMYFGLQGKGYEYDRFDDIWCGVFVKRVLDHLRLGVHSGQPHINHIRASDKFSNLIKEAPGIKENEFVWRAVDSVELFSQDPIGAMRELISKTPLQGEYWKKFFKAFNTWLDLCQKYL